MPPNNIIYVDETGFDRYFYREYAYAPRGQTVAGKIFGRKFARTNLVAGLLNGVPIAEKLYLEHTNAAVFEAWFSDVLLPKTPPKSVIVMDNATFHRKKRLHIIANNFGRSVLFLPPYSPDLNPIEKLWANVKKRLKSIPKITCLYDAIFEALKC